jgi:hypothetical protein
LFLRSVQSMELLAPVAVFHATAMLTQPVPELSQLPAGLAGMVDAVLINQVPAPDRSPGQVVTELLPGLPARQAANLRAAVAAINTVWICWKQLHYGVAKRVIGDVPGTGGTSGIAYLKQHMNIPLLEVGDTM